MQNLTNYSQYPSRVRSICGSRQRSIKRLNFLTLGQCERIHLKWTRDANDTGCVIMNLRKYLHIDPLDKCFTCGSLLSSSIPFCVIDTILRGSGIWTKLCSPISFNTTCWSLTRLLYRIGMCLLPQIPSIKSAW